MASVDVSFLYSGAVYAVFLLAALLQGLTGFGFGMVSMALLPFLIGARTASIIVAPIALFNTAYLSWRLRRFVNRRMLAMLFAGSLVGVPIGVYFLTVFPDAILKRLIGAAILAYCLYYAWQTRGTGRVQKGLAAWLSVPAGLLGGVLGGAVSAGGPPVIFYLYQQPWEREMIQGTLVAFFCLIAATKVGLLIGTGLLGWEFVPLLLVLPAIWVGSRLGLYVNRRLNPRLFSMVVIVALTVLGLTLLARG